MAGLIGLSPEEISAISGRRTATESDRYKMAGMLINMMGAKQQGELARRKLELLENPPMVQMKTEGGQIFEVPRMKQAEGIRAKANVDEAYRTGRISQAEHDAWMKPVHISLPDGAGGWIPYETQSGMLQEIAAGIKNLQDIRVSGVEEERKRRGIEALGETTIGGIGDVPLSTLAATMPGGVIPAMVAKPRAGVAGLKPEERRKLIKDHEESAFKITAEGPKTTDASIQSYNERSRTLNYPSMMFRYKETKPWWPDVHEIVEIKLPVVGGKQITPTQIQEAATKRGVSVEQILETIHAGQLAIENSKR
jgi:hypothetical protein